jgi:hypothetical protein
VKRRELEEGYREEREREENEKEGEKERGKKGWWSKKGRERGEGGIRERK